MAEQFAFDEPRADRAAIHLHQRAVLTRAAVVNGAGDEFLACAGLAQDEHGGINPGDLLDLP